MTIMKRISRILAAALCFGLFMTAGFAHAEDDIDHLRTVWANTPAEGSYQSAESLGIGWDEVQGKKDSTVTTVRAVDLYRETYLDTKEGSIPEGAKMEVITVVGVSTQIVYNGVMYYVRTADLW